MNKKNNSYIALLILGILSTTIGISLKLNEAASANILLACGILLEITSIIFLLSHNTTKTKPSI